MRNSHAEPARHIQTEREGINMHRIEGGPLMCLDRIRNTILDCDKCPTKLV